MNIRRFVALLGLCLFLGWTSVYGLTGYKYYKVITIVENSGSAVTTYPVKLTTNTQALISAGKMQTDGDDLRIVDNNNIELDRHLININTSATDIWFRISMTASQTKYFKMYYGNEGVSSPPSDKNNIFGITPDNDCTLCLHFEEISGSTVDDSSIANDDAITNNMEDADWQAGKWGNCLTFGGTDEFVSGFNTTKLPLTSTWTVVCWVYIDTTNSCTIFGNNNGQAGRWNLVARDTGYSNLLYFACVGSPTVVTQSNASLTAQAWTHIAIRREGNTWTLFINGVAQTDVDTATSTLDDDAPNLGRNPNGWYFIGKIDEFRVYESALSNTAISNFYVSSDPTASLGTENTVRSPRSGIAAINGITIY